MLQQRSRLLRPTIILVGLSVVFLLPSAAAFYTDWLWFKEVGFEAIFARRLRTSFLTGGVVFAVAFAGLWTNALVALSVLTQPYVVIASTAQGQPILFNRAQVRRAATIIATVAALAMALPASSRWLDLLEYRYAVPFGQTDPIFNRDVSFYVFQLPVYDFVRGIALAVVILSLVCAAGIYILAGAVGIGPRNRVDTRRTRVHLSLLAAALFLVMAVGAWLDTFRILVSSSGGIVHGGSYVDVHARLPFLYATTVVLGVGAILALVHAFTRYVWPIPAAIGLYFVVAMAGALYAAIVQRVIVAPNEQAREQPFIERNVAATRRAFGLDTVEERELPGDTLLTRADVAANAETLENVRLWDHQPLLDTFGQIQEIRSYYDFVSVDNDRYVVNGKYRQIMLSGRELNSDSLQNRTWVNERLNFTHGFGVTLGPVNQVTTEGLPVLFIKDIPPVSAVDLQVREPSLYFGELSSNYVLVRTRVKEFHHPKGDDNVYTEYSGRGGVPLGGLWRRLLFTLRFRSTDILLTDVVTPDSRVIFHRRIMDRLGEIAPFISYDDDPYLVIADGRLFWMCDAYTVTNHYPYSTPTNRSGLNYIRNSVKIVIDAYDGTTTYYLADDRDPLVQTLARVFPTLFRPLADMPASLRRHVRYPEDIFAIQAAVFSTFHMTNPAVFYNKEDQWEVPAIETEGNPVAMQPYYTIMKLPGEKRAEFIQMLPFTPRRKDNLAAWMVARSDGNHYGTLLVFQFPKQKVVFGPRQIVARINQDQVISPQITLWNQQGSQVIQGTLLVIPIEQSLLYIRPLYLRASGGRIPELKRVIVAHQNQIVMEETLPAALNRLFGPGAARVERPPETPVTVPVDTSASQPPPVVADRTPPAAPTATATGESLETLAGLAHEHYQRALQAQRDGNWALYGEEIKKLGEVLERMRARK
jgi:uncharacterized protein